MKIKLDSACVKYIEILTGSKEYSFVTEEYDKLIIVSLKNNSNFEIYSGSFTISENTEYFINQCIREMAVDYLMEHDTWEDWAERDFEELAELLYQKRTLNEHCLNSPLNKFIYEKIKEEE